MIYMDNIGRREQELEVSALHTYLTIGLLEMLEFVVNWTISIQNPIQVSDDYLGFMISSVEIRLYLSRAKIFKIRNL